MLVDCSYADLELAALHVRMHAVIVIAKLREMFGKLSKVFCALYCIHTSCTKKLKKHKMPGNGKKNGEKQFLETMMTNILLANIMCMNFYHCYGLPRVSTLFLWGYKNAGIFCAGGTK